MKISIFCLITITTLVYSPINANDKYSRQETEEVADDANSDDAEAEQCFLTKEKVKIIVAAAICLFIVASIKYEFFPSAEQKRLRALNGPKTGLTGMSTSFENSLIRQIFLLLRKC